MAGIVIFGGTTEGRKLAEAFADTSLQIKYCVATDYGATLLPEAQNIQTHTGRLDREEMKQYLKLAAPELVLDATHPYATVVTGQIAELCKEEKLPLLRILREADRPGEKKPEEMWGETRPADGQAILVDSVAEAVEVLKETEGKILITTGSKELEQYAELENYKERCVARVLPTLSVMEKCSELGFQGKNLIAMQGPFSLEMNVELIKATGCRYLVTKESGREGGYEEKCLAALQTGATLVVVKRPKEAEEENRVSLGEAISCVEKQFQVQEKRTVYLVGMGPGNPALLTKEALDALERAEVLIGADRMLQICRQMPEFCRKPVFCAYQKEKIAGFLREHREYKSAALLYSGDIGFYSGANQMQSILAEFGVVPVSGISSLEYFLNKIGVSRERVPAVSCHGKKENLIWLLQKYGSVCTLLGKGEEITGLCERLLEFQIKDVFLTVGERLSYPEERIVKGTPEQLKEQAFSDLSVLYMCYAEDRQGESRGMPGIPDESFLRELGENGTRVPMTKQTIRVLSLAKLNLTENAILYDVGAGSGSVSVEGAGLCPGGMVYAIEKKPEAVELLRKNRCHFQVENMEIVAGEAPEVLKDLPAPSHVFIGGSSGRLFEIVEAVREKNREARFVVNAVTLETIAQIQKLPEKFPEYQDMDILQVSASGVKKIGGYHLLHGENPVWIVSFGHTRKWGLV